MLGLVWRLPRWVHEGLYRLTGRVVVKVVDTGNRRARELYWGRLDERGRPYRC